MKKILLSLTLFLGLSMTAAAQGMSDSQVQSYIQREMKTGASQSQIVMRLMQRGVTAQQLQRVRKQMTETGGMTGSGASGTGLGRMPLLPASVRPTVLSVSTLREPLW